MWPPPWADVTVKYVWYKTPRGSSCSGYDPMKGDAAGICLEHNATPGLVAIARAALVAQEWADYSAFPIAQRAGAALAKALADFEAGQ